MAATADPRTNGNVEQAAEIQIDRIREEHLRVPIVGVSPLIMHRFSEKAKKQMLDAAQGRQTPKEPKNPQAEYESAFYRLADGGYGFPADAFKQATVGAARFYGKAVTMTALKQFVFIGGRPGDLGPAQQRVAKVGRDTGQVRVSWFAGAPRRNEGVDRGRQVTFRSGLLVAVQQADAEVGQCLHPIGVE